MKQIGLGAIMYADSNGGRFPDDLDTLMDSQDLSPAVLMCPDSSGDVPVEPTTREVVSTMRKSNLISYTYLGKGLTIQASADTVLLYERLGSHGDGMNVLFADGHVEYLEANEAGIVLKQVSAGSSPILYPLPTSQPMTLPATRQ
jgi:prepilin-type processing-associated H-X9-DG protein